jgi:transposase
MLDKKEINDMSNKMLVRYISKLNTVHNREKRKLQDKIDLLNNRVQNKNKRINSKKYQIFLRDRRLYAQKSRLVKEKTIAKNEMYDKAVTNIVSRKSELIDIPRYHMSLVELSSVFGKPEMFIILLLWASRYDYYSKREFNANFKNSPIPFMKYNMMLVKEGYANKWDMKRSTYFISGQGKDLVDKINKFVNKRLNG